MSAEDAAAVMSDGLAKLYKTLGGNSVAYGSEAVATGHYSHAVGYESIAEQEKERWDWLDDDTE